MQCGGQEFESPTVHHRGFFPDKSLIHLEDKSQSGGSKSFILRIQYSLGKNQFLEQRMICENLMPAYFSEEFVVGEDSFEDVEINDAQTPGGLFYFKNSRKGLVKRFVLEYTLRTKKACTVTLIKRPNGSFTPKFDFQIWDISKKAIENSSKESANQNLIKAKVSFDSCHESFLILLDFIRSIKGIEFSSDSYAVVDRKKKEIMESLGTYDRLEIISAVQKKFGSELSEKDAILLLNRKSKLEYFGRLLKDESFFEDEKKFLEVKKNEDVWQNFFENNQWIFGYGLQLVSCEGLDERKLEQTVVGNDLIDGSGKRIDALLKTKGNIAKLLFCEIKMHSPDLLVEPYDRPGVYVPAKELRGAVAQIQKTIQKVNLKINQNLIRPSDREGNPTGEEILFVKPRGVVIIGMLNDFKTDMGINSERLSSFEIYRQQVSGIDIITYDELYERVRFIVEE